MEKTSSELFAEEIEIGKEIIEAQNFLDQVSREIISLRNEIDKIRTTIRNKDGEALNWKKVIRTKRQIKDEKHQQAWATRHSGL